MSACACGIRGSMNIVIQSDNRIHETAAHHIVNQIEPHWRFCAVVKLMLTNLPLDNL